MVGVSKFRWTLCALVLIALSIYFYCDRFLPSSEFDLPHFNSTTMIISNSTPSSEKEKTFHTLPCDFSNGTWIHDLSGPLYNGTTCKTTIKEAQNCMKHGRPDDEYLYWRWNPNNCKLSRFEPNTFLKLIEDKHIAFVGDSLARNQYESLLCMLSIASKPNLVYTKGHENRFRKWYFDSHNASASLYWSPFLVQGFEKSKEGPNYNKMYLDVVDEKWTKDIDEMDLVVLSIGHWFLKSSIYYEGDLVLGCYSCADLGGNETGFRNYHALKKALRTTLDSIIDKRVNIDVVVTTFPPHHFEGDWDKGGVCPKIKPYRNREKELEVMHGDMRRVEIEEVEAAKVKGRKNGRVRFEALDITRLAFLRPDGHPGLYTRPLKFANGVQKRMPNDCTHWCLPGPIDTWNEILLEIMKKWEQHPSIEE